MVHACHPALRASVSTWEGLLCRFSYVDVWLQQAARDRIASTCKLVVSLALVLYPILGEMSLRNLWHKTYNLCLRVSEWYLFGQRSGWIVRSNRNRLYWPKMICNRLHCQFNRNRRLRLRLSLDISSPHHCALNRGCGGWVSSLVIVC